MDLLLQGPHNIYKTILKSNQKKEQKSEILITHPTLNNLHSFKAEENSILLDLLMPSYDF